jgi:hypothetical protein
MGDASMGDFSSSSSLHAINDLQIDLEAALQTCGALRHENSVLRSNFDEVKSKLAAMKSQLDETRTFALVEAEGKVGTRAKCLRWVHTRWNFIGQNAILHALFLICITMKSSDNCPLMFRWLLSDYANHYPGNCVPGITRTRKRWRPFDSSLRLLVISSS